MTQEYIYCNHSLEHTHIILLVLPPSVTNPAQLTSLLPFLDPCSVALTKVLIIVLEQDAVTLLKTFLIFPIWEQSPKPLECP